ncbi:MAG TPA: GH92 family glycosyl hydrolase [Solirubrobacterales bacterium]|nr:GH92 family glycosyl hydrolase [Solirubrobacterales bacterium]
MIPRYRRTAGSRSITSNFQISISRSALAALVVALGLAGTAPAASAGGFASRVDPFAGTSGGPGTFGRGNNFPGASVPFGMVQWSPDTTPSDKNLGGYSYRDNHLKGFSLTHLSGAGCRLYGDFPFMPTTEPIESSPQGTGQRLDGDFQPGFSHAGESARPGYYSVRLNPVHGGAIETELTATTRTGMARFTFPRSPHASVLINAGGSAQPDDFAEVQLDPGAQEISGTASSGLFCAQRPRYRVYFAAVFNRPFSEYGSWEGNRLRPGSISASASQSPAANPRSTAAGGAYATFDTGKNRVVVARVGVSFVSVEDARANLAAENPGDSFGAVAEKAQRSWNASLGRIRVSGGSASHLQSFYTALYHVFMAPRTFSDVNGAYPGMDGQIHDAGKHIQYADFSGWDTYRTQIQLLSILAPTRAGDMVRSLLADARESGCLPRWSYANGQSMTMVGDSADPIIASAAAFGADGFDKRAALEAMVKGATEPCHSTNGEYVERQGLSAYLARGYIPFELDTKIGNADSIYGSPEAVWGSAATSLEYYVDDFAIAQFAARSLHDQSTYSAFMRRSGNWRRLYNPASGMIEPRYAGGAFPNPYYNRSEAGFVEGDSAQYTWMVPQDPAGLLRRMGGRTKAAARLGYFLRNLNGGAGGTRTDHALLGNEPTIQTPWLYDWMGRPWRTQEAVRRALTLYSPAPDGYPGNDDLGTLSAWYVFGALGLYPEVPGVGVLALSSPLFEKAEIRLRHRRRALLSVVGHGRYIRSLTLGGHAYRRPWISYCELAAGADLEYQLGKRPNRNWGTAAAVSPPSYGPGRDMPKSACGP